MDVTWLVAGLGNPGPGYATHRHNVGAMVVAELARRGGATFKAHRMLRADLATIRVGPDGAGAVGSDALRVILLRTATYMNDSGIPLRNVLTHDKVKPDHLIVVHDELDLDLGRLRVKFGGGDNGHNGLRSIRALTGTGDFYRVRIGIGRPPGRQDVMEWVLAPFAKAERDDRDAMVIRAADAIESLLTIGLATTQQRFNS